MISECMAQSKHEMPNNTRIGLNTQKNNNSRGVTVMSELVSSDSRGDIIESTSESVLPLFFMWQTIPVASTAYVYGENLQTDCHQDLTNLIPAAVIVSGSHPLLPTSMTIADNATTLMSLSSSASVASTSLTQTLGEGLGDDQRDIIESNKENDDGNEKEEDGDNSCSSADTVDWHRTLSKQRNKSLDDDDDDLEEDDLILTTGLTLITSRHSSNSSGSVSSRDSDSRGSSHKYGVDTYGSSSSKFSQTLDLLVDFTGTADNSADTLSAPAAVTSPLSAVKCRINPSKYNNVSNESHSQQCSSTQLNGSSRTRNHETTKSDTSTNAETNSSSNNSLNGHSRVVCSSASAAMAETTPLITPSSDDNRHRHHDCDSRSSEYTITSASTQWLIDFICCCRCFKLIWR